VMEEFCSLLAPDTNYKSNKNSEAVSPSTGYKVESEVSAKVGGPSLVTTTLVVMGVLLLCAIGGCLILAKVEKRLRKREKTPEYCDVYVRSASYVSLNSYAEVGARASYVSVQSNAGVVSDSKNATEYSYAAVQ